MKPRKQNLGLFQPKDTCEVGHLKSEVMFQSTFPSRERSSFSENKKFFIPMLFVPERPIFLHIIQGKKNPFQLGVFGLKSCSLFSLQ